MYNYSYKSIVSKNESEALKELIFNRARERAEALNKNTQESYTSSIRNDLMDIARESFSKSGNPFAIKNETKEEPVAKKEAKKDNIGFPERKTGNNLKSQIENKNSSLREATAQNEIDSVMETTSSNFSNKKNFIGALNFLNSQAGLSIFNNSKHKFEALA